MTLTDIIRSAIVAAGGDGLVNTDLGCGCGSDCELAPCDSPNLDECRVAKARVLGPEEGYVHEAADLMLGPGDTIYDPIEVAK